MAHNVISSETSSSSHQIRDELNDTLNDVDENQNKNNKSKGRKGIKGRLYEPYLEYSNLECKVLIDKLKAKLFK